MSLPKVLIIGQPFNKSTGGGITLSNLFAGWEIDKLGVVCTGHISDNLDLSICNNYYLLGQKECKWIFPFNYLQRKLVSGQLIFKAKDHYVNSVNRNQKIRAKIINNVFYPLLTLFGIFHMVSKIELSEELCEWLKEFNPDIIYAQASSRETINFCRALHKFIKKPLIFHMMDDWPLTISNRGLLKTFWFKRIDYEFRSLLNEATILLSISDEMAREYKSRYNKEFITFHNPIDLEFWKKYQRNTYEITASPTILYAGRTGTGIQSSLEVIAKAIELVNYDLDITMKFVLQTKEKPLWISNYKCVVHRKFGSYNELPELFSGADLLILPYDFSEESFKFIQYSMPTKATEYMISGTPIIVFSPKDTAIVKYANNHKWAKVITENDYIKLAEAIKYLIENKIIREQIAHNAMSISEKNHNSITITHNFKKLISSLV